MKKFHLSIILTHKCNLNCVYCYEQNKNAKRINVEKAKEHIVKSLNCEDYDEVVIEFFGGEPFLEFGAIKEICEWVWSQQWRNKYIFFTTTNGTLVHGEIQEWLKVRKKYFYVSLSLDGTKSAHDKNRCNSFDNIDIAFFKECWPDQTVKMTISKETVDSIFENIVYIHSLGFGITGTNFAEGIDWENERYKEIVFKQLERLCEYYIEHPEIEPVPLVNMRIFKCEGEKRRNKWCGCGEYMTACEVDGEKYPCTFFTPMTFDKETLESISGIDWNNPELFIDNDCYEICYLNPVCNSCYGANLLSTGQLNKRDKSKCELMKIRAIFSSALQANRLLSKKTEEFTAEDLLAMKAIKKIHELYSTS